MHEIAIASMDTTALAAGLEWLGSVKRFLLVFVGFSAVIFVHELGHFLVAKWCDVRIDKFAVGFGKAIASFRRGIGFRWGNTENEYREGLREWVARNRAKEGRSHDESEPSEAELALAARESGLGETEYCFNVLPVGGYVKMLGQEDFAVDKSGELRVKEDPRAFTHKPIGQRMIIVSAGVAMNLVFAAFVFMIVFMLGLEAPSAEVGMVMPGSPADRAGLRMGDVITRINGRAVSDRGDLVGAVVLADPDEDLTIAYKRKDPATGEWKEYEQKVRPVMMPGEDTLKIGVAAPATTEVVFAVPDPALPPEDQLQKGDVVTAVEGREVSDFVTIALMAADALGDWVDLTVQRPQPGGEPKEAKARLRARLFFVPTGKPGQQDENLLGFVPRRLWNELLDPGASPMSELRRGDVIVRWGGILAPRMSEIRQSIEDNPGKDIQVTVLRDGKEQIVTVRPKPRSAFGRTIEPLLTQTFWTQEIGAPVIADVVTEVTPEIKTPAAALTDIMPRGSRLTKLNGEPVESWSALTKKFIKLAGQDVTVSWTYEGTPEQSATIYIPRTLDTELGLPVASAITAINGKSRVEVELNGRRDSYDVNSAIGQRAVIKELLDQNIQEAEVSYQSLLDPGAKSQKVALSPEMLDAWTKRIAPTGIDVIARPKVITIQHRNPIKAMMVGIWKTYYFVEHVYLMAQRMLITRSVSTDQISGPVGIFRLGGDFAGLGITYLLYFLALISANLAVINFLPLPIVDGGLFVFLLIEKIKGKPISLRVQVATQVIGLVLIISIFAWVTFQDILKFW